MLNKKPKVLFFSTTSYVEPIQESISKKFNTLEELATIKIFAYRDGEANGHPGSSIFHLFKRPNNRFTRYIKTVFITLFTMRGHFSKADIVVIQDPVLAGFVLFSFKGLNNKPKLVVESHGDFIETITLEKNLLFPWFYKFILKKIASYSLNNANCIRVISSSTRYQVESFVKNKPIVKFPAWIDLENFLNTEHNPSDSIVLFLGSITERKNPLLILRSLSYIKSKCIFKLYIVGPHLNNTYLELLKEYIRNNNLEERVVIKGEVGQKEVIDYLSKSSLLVLPSKSEGLGRVILEAQAVGCPVLVSDAGGMKDLIEHKKTGFIFKNEDLIDLGDNIEFILKNNELVNDITQSGKENVIEFYKSNSFLNGYKQIFEKVK